MAYKGPNTDVDADAREWFQGLNPTAQGLVNEQIKLLEKEKRFAGKRMSDQSFLQLLYRVFTFADEMKLKTWPKGKPVEPKATAYRKN